MGKISILHLYNKCPVNHSYLTADLEVKTKVKMQKIAKMSHTTGDNVNNNLSFLYPKAF